MNTTDKDLFSSERMASKTRMLLCISDIELTLDRFSGAFNVRKKTQQFRELVLAEERGERNDPLGLLNTINEIKLLTMESDGAMTTLAALDVLLSAREIKEELRTYIPLLQNRSPKL